MRFVKYSEEALRNPLQKQREKQQLADQLRVRGTSQIPNPPRDLFYQAGPRGALITWKLPESGEEQIAAWRVYRNTETELYADVRDRAARQYFVEMTSGSTPPVTPVFISSVNALGIESQKVQINAKASTEAGAPTMPSAPPGYTTESSGGGDTDGGLGTGRDRNVF